MVLARPWVAGIYSREPFADRVIPYTARKGARDPGGKWRLAKSLKAERFDCAILLQNAFEAALIAWLARIPRRIGYGRDGRGLLLTDAIPVPLPGEIERHESHYYLELLRRAGIIDSVERVEAIRLDGAKAAAECGRKRFDEAGLAGPVIGVSPGAAFGSAKRWYPERFAETAARLAGSESMDVALFGSAAKQNLCESVAGQIREAGAGVHNFAGRTALGEFIEMAAACRIFLTNDSGAMHIASALGVPTVAVFGATDHAATGPTGPLSRVVLEPVDCAPCKLRECPIDHRCMTRVSVDRVLDEVQALLGKEV